MAPRYCINDFKYGVRPPSWIYYDIIILHRKTAFYVPNFGLNFHIGLLRSFRYIVFHVSAFWPEIANSCITTVYLTTIVTRFLDENDIFIRLESSIPALQDGYSIFDVNKI